MRKIILKQIRPFLAVHLILFFFFISFGQENLTLTADYNMGNEIEIDKVRKFAFNEAESSWGDVSMGPIIPLCDTRGNIIAYEIIFSLNGKEFPEKKAVYENISNAKELIKLADERNNKELKETAEKKRWGINDYMTMTVGARYDVVPLLEYHEGLPPYFTKLEEAIEIAKPIINSANPVLNRIYAIGFLDKWFEFKSGQKTVLINAHSLKIVKKERLNFLAANENIDLRQNNETEFRNIWQSIFSKMEKDTSGTEQNTLNKASYTVTEVRINGVPAYYDPDVTWRGCTPMAATMILGYWHLQRGYTNLMQNGANSLNLELFDALGTILVGGEWFTFPTNNPGGIEYVANTIHGYKFNCYNEYGVYTQGGTISSSWGTILGEITSNRPTLWGVLDYTVPPNNGGNSGTEVTHSVAVIGYQIKTFNGWPVDNQQYYAIVHNGWMAGDHYWIVHKKNNWGNYYSDETYADVVTHIIADHYVDVTVKNSPSGGSVIVDGVTQSSPYTTKWNRGSNHTIGALVSQQIGSDIYFFSSWSDQSGRVHSVSSNNMSETYIAYLDRIFGSVVISGPSSIPYKENGTWNAVPNGGSGSFQYNWYKDGTPVSTSSSYTTRSTVNFTLELSVTDTKQNITKSDTKYITIGGTPPKISLLPENFNLSQNYPNPFNPKTKINFQLPEANEVTLKVYDISGREVVELVNCYMRPGYHSVNFEADNLPSGVYIYKIKAGKFTDVKKMTLMK